MKVQQKLVSCQSSESPLEFLVCTSVITPHCLYASAGLQVSVVGLERALHQYTLEPSEKPFDLKSVPLATQSIQDQKPGNNKALIGLL